MYFFFFVEPDIKEIQTSKLATKLATNVVSTTQENFKIIEQEDENKLPQFNSNDENYQKEICGGGYDAIELIDNDLFIFKNDVRFLYFL